MSYTLQLGSSFPYANGTIIADLSRYIGNNTFVRLLSQQNDNKTMIGLYTVDSIYTSTPVITTVHEQVLFETVDLHNPRLTLLGNGSIMIIGNYGSTTATLYYAVVRFDNVTNTFVTEIALRTFWESGVTTSDLIYEDFAYIEKSGASYISNDRVYYNIYAYDSSSIVYITMNTVSNIRYLSVGIIEDVYGSSNTTSGAIRLFRDTTLDNYYNPMYTNIKKYDGLLHITYSNYYIHSSSIIDVINKTTITQRSSYQTDMVKLDTDRYVSLAHTFGDEVKFNLANSLSTTTSAATRFEPILSAYGSYPTKEYFRWTIPLDRFHAIHFRNTNGTVIGAYVLKFVDENYGFVSDASQNGITVANNPVFGSIQEQYQRIRLGVMSDGEWLKKMSATQFMIQTGYNTFQTFEISPTATP